MAKAASRKASLFNASDPVYFATSAAFRLWLSEHSSTSKKLIVGYYKVSSGKPSLSWPESVDEALCFGWIDGRRTRIDDSRYQISFSPRKPGSTWSAVNIRKVDLLRSQGRMTAPGLTAFALRNEEKSKVYSYEQTVPARLSRAEISEFKKARGAWQFFAATPAGYRRAVLHWVTQAKKQETRSSRFRRLVEACAAGERIR